MSVGFQERLIGEELLPADVALVVVLEKYVPVLSALLVAIRQASTSLPNRGPLASSSEHVGTSVQRVAQECEHVVVVRDLPAKRRATSA